MRQRNTVRRATTDLQALKQRAFAQRCKPMIETLESRRLLSAGDLDTTFSGDGKVTTDLGTAEQANKVLVQSDGKVLVVGAGNGDARLVRYNTNGTLDTTFDGDGSTRLSWSGTENFTDAALLPDGRIVVGGNHNGGWWLARYKSNGTLDVNSGFGGTDGIYNGGSAGGSGSITELELQGSNIITADAAGNVRRHSGSTGGVDTSFGSGGSVNVGAVTGMTDFVLEDLAMAPGGKIAVAGSADTSFGDGTVPSYAVARLNPNGTADTTFAGDGSLVHVYEQHWGRATGVVAQPDGKLVTIAEEADDSDAFILRVNVNGTPDTSFGSGSSGRPGSTVMFGYLAHPAPAPALASDLSMQSDGKILVFGWQELFVEGSSDFSPDFIVQRFTSSGLPDNTFSGDSLTSADFTGLSWDRARTMAVAPDGRIVVAGETGEPGNTSHLAVARFEGGGTVTPPPGDEPVYIQDRVLHVDGTAGNDTIKTVGGFGGSEVVDVTLNGVTSRFHQDDFDRILIRSFAGNDSFDDDSPYATLFEGGDGNDSVLTFNDEGGVFATVVGGAGDDVVEFDAAPVTELSPFDGGTGRDKIIIGPNFGFDLDLRDFPTVEDGQIRSFGTLTGNSLNNHLTIDEFGTIYAGDGNDTLGGGAFPNFVDLYGENGNDVLNGNSVAREPGFPPNILDGGAGNDTLQPGTGNERLIGGAGTDELTYASRTTALNITLGAGVNNDGAAGEGDDAAGDIERVRGGSGNDSITGTSAGNTFFGNAGDDTLFGMGGNDALFGGSANDRIRGGTGNDYIEGNSGNDTLYGDAGLDRILGHDGNDYFWVRDGERDTLDGGVGNFDRAQVDSIDLATNMEAFIP